MKGFIITFRGEKYTVGISDAGSYTDIMITTQEEKISCIIGGLDNEGVSYSWLKTSLFPDDEIVVEVANINDNSVITPAERFVIADKDTVNQAFIKRYHELKAELTAEGLL